MRGQAPQIFFPRTASGAMQTILDQELIPYHLVVLLFLVLLIGAASSSKKPTGTSVSKRIWMKFGRIVRPVNTHLVFVMTSYFQDGGHDVTSARRSQRSPAAAR